MKVIVSGSRHIENYPLFCKIVEASGFTIDSIIHGGARGVDSLASRYAKTNSLEEIVFTADWNTHGRGAGPIRNAEMIDSVKGQNVGFICVWDGKSRGTFDCLKRAQAAGLPAYVYTLPYRESVNNEI